MEPDADSSDSDSREGKIARKKKNYSLTKPYNTSYNISWEKDLRFKSFIRKSSKSKHHFFCTYCSNDISVKSKGISDLIRHKNGAKHMKIEEERIGQVPVNEHPGVAAATRLDKQIIEAEIRFAAFYAEHNVSFRAASHASQLNAAMFPDSKIAQKFKCSKTKTKMIITNVLGRMSAEELFQILRQQKFSLIIDESTDRGTVEHLALIARYFDHTKLCVRDQHFGLVPLEKGDHVSIYNAIVNFFNEQNIPYQDNMVGFGADGASVNFGVENSLSVLLKKDIPGLFILSCTCHGFAIVASNACKELPRFVEDLIRDVYNYLKSSSKRLVSFQKFQKLCDLNPHKLLKAGQTRWLSLEKAVSRILEQYDALLLFFQEETRSTETKLLAPEKILNWLRDPQTKVFLLFLDYILPIFNKLNRLFQSETTLIHELYDDVLCLYKDVLSCYMKREHFDENAQKVAPGNPSFFLNIDDIYIGTNAMLELMTVNDPKISHFIKTRCLNFLVTAAKEIRRKFPFLNSTETVLKELSILSPKNIFKAKFLTPLLQHFPFLNPNLKQNIDSEFRRLNNHKDRLNTDALSFELFWIDIFKCKCGNDMAFPNLYNFMTDYVLILPHSSANVERTFSIINNNKNKTRSNLNTNSLDAILHTKELLKYNNFSFTITQSIIDKFNVSMYDFKRGVAVEDSSSENDDDY